MIFFVNSKLIKYIRDVIMSYFPCKFLIYIEKKIYYNISSVKIVKMSRFKQINKYLDDINYVISNVLTYDEDYENNYQKYLRKIGKK
jgi:hypothetical protein